MNLKKLKIKRMNQQPYFVKEVGPPKIVDGVTVFPIKIKGKFTMELPKGSYVPPVGTIVKIRVPQKNDEDDGSIELNAPPSRAKNYKNVENESAVETEKK